MCVRLVGQAHGVREEEPLRSLVPVPTTPQVMLEGFMASTVRMIVACVRGAMKIRPLHDRVLAKRVADVEKTSGGLFIPDNAKEKPLEATVVAVGAGKRMEDGRLQALTLKPGDRILIGKYSGSEVKVDGNDHIILGEDDVLAVLE